VALGCGPSKIHINAADVDYIYTDKGNKERKIASADKIQRIYTLLDSSTYVSPNSINVKAHHVISSFFTLS